MKKIFFMMMMAVMAIAASAQVKLTPEQLEQESEQHLTPWRVGFRFNIGPTNVIGEGDKMSLGCGILWTVEYNFTQRFFLQSGLGFENICHDEEMFDGSLTGYFFQLPVHAGYRFWMKGRTSLFIQGGPAFGIGIKGSKMDFGNQVVKYFDVAKRFDLGIGGRFGVEFNKWQITAGVHYGLLEAMKYVNGYHNFSLNLGVAYMF